MATGLPLIAEAAANARAYLGDERVPGQVQPPYVTGAISAESRAGSAGGGSYAYAYANLNTGILRAVGQSLYAPPYATTSDATAGFADSITFSGGSGLTAYLDYAFDGTLGVVADTYPKAAFAQLEMNIATLGGSVTRYETLSAYGANCGSAITNCVVGTSTALTGTVEFPIFSDAITSFSMNLNGFASIGNSFDFGNTARFNLRLPSSEVSYTSASGSFLLGASAINAVPEPQALALLLTALGVLLASSKLKARQV